MVKIIPNFIEPLPKSSIPNKIQAFETYPAISQLPGKTFDIAGGNIAQRTIEEHQRLGINTDPNKRLHWYYEAEIKNLIIGILHKTNPNGLGSLSNSEMDTIAQSVSSQIYEYIVTDYEPHNPADGWVWESFQHPEKINYISQKVKDLTLSGGNFKKFLDWFQPKGFTYAGKQLSILPNNGVFEFGGSTVQDYINCHGDLEGISGFLDEASVLRLGWGYSSKTYLPDNAGGAAYGPNVNYFGAASFLKSLDSVALATALRPTKQILYIIWAMEDQARINYEARFRLGGDTQGFVRMKENRLSYSFHAVAGNVFIANSFKNVTKLHSWIMPTGENPIDILRYARRNGQNWCLDPGFFLADYTGPDQFSLPCPTSGIDFMIPAEAKGFNGILSGLHRSHLCREVLDGTQTPSFPAFRWKYDGKPWNEVGAISDLSGFARSWKDKKPFALKQTNTGSKNLIIFKHPFTMAFKPVRFECSSLGIDEYVEGNNVFAAIVT